MYKFGWILDRTRSGCGFVSDMIALSRAAIYLVLFKQKAFYVKKNKTPGIILMPPYLSQTSVNEKKFLNSLSPAHLLTFFSPPPPPAHIFKGEENREGNRWAQFRCRFRFVSLQRIL